MFTNAVKHGANANTCISFFWGRGDCKRGTGCPYAHDINYWRMKVADASEKADKVVEMEVAETEVADTENDKKRKLDVDGAVVEKQKQNTYFNRRTQKHEPIVVPSDKHGCKFCRLTNGAVAHKLRNGYNFCSECGFCLISV